MKSEREIRNREDKHRSKQNLRIFIYNLLLNIIQGRKWFISYYLTFLKEAN